MNRSGAPRWDWFRECGGFRKEPHRCCRPLLHLCSIIITMIIIIIVVVSLSTRPGPSSTCRPGR